MSKQIAVKHQDGTIHLVPEAGVDAIYDMMETLGGEEALALTIASWNMEGSVNVEDVKNAMIDFYTNVLIFRKAVGRMLRGEEI